MNRDCVRLIPLGEPARRLVALAGLLALGAASYYPAVHGDFVWDDIAILRESVIHAWSGLVDIWLSPRAITREGHYWPLVYTSFWIEHKLWGLDPFGYHIVNIALHVVNTVLVWRLLERIGVPAAWLAAALFAVHPVHVQSVAWIIERKDLLSALCYLLAAIAWLEFEAAPRRGRYLRVLALYVAALLSKSVAVTFPAAMLVWAWWRQGRLTAVDLRRTAPLFAVGLAITAADLLYYRSVETVSFGYGPVERLLNAAHAVWFYLAKLAWPADLAIVYPLSGASAPDPLAWLLALGVLVVPLVLWAGRRRFGRGPLAAAAFFALTLSPMLGFVDFGYMRFSLVADRFQYLASVGPLALAATLAGALAARLPGAPRASRAAWQRVARWVGAGAVLALLLPLTWSQSGLYRNQVTFFLHVVEHNPADAEMQFNLGKALQDAGRFEESVDVNRRAAALHPLERRFPQHAGEALRKLRRFDEAVEAYRDALAIDPDYALANGGLGVALLKIDRPAEALAFLERAIELSAALRGALYPSVARAHIMLGRLREAAAAYRKAIEATPARASLHANLGSVLAATGAFDEAVASFDRALVLNPGLDMARQGRQAAVASAARARERGDRSRFGVLSLHPKRPFLRHSISRGFPLARE